MATILNFGSLNIDHVYTVEHIVRPGETLGSDRYEVFPGGKGANQSAALALAGAQVRHAGRIGADGGWLLEGLEELGVDVSTVVVDQHIPTGHAIIQVEAASGENAIVLYPGSNRTWTSPQVRATLEGATDDDVVLLQNEINRTDEILSGARERGLTVCWNPAPFDATVTRMPLASVDLLVVNETEAAGLAGPGLPEPAGEASAREPDPDALEALLAGLRPRLRPEAEVLLTLGGAGSLLDGPNGRLRTGAVAAGPVVDTTAAGDTFLGTFLAARTAGLDDEACLHRAAVAAGLCVTRSGARDAIPTAAEVDACVDGGTKPLSPGP